MIGGYLYVLWNPVYDSYGTNVYKLGRTENLVQRKYGYTTPYIDPSSYKHTSLYFNDMDAAEKILFVLLKEYRIKNRREFFKCDLDTIVTQMKRVELLLNIEVTSSINLTEKNNIEVNPPIDNQESDKCVKIQIHQSPIDNQESDKCLKIQNQCPLCKQHFSRLQRLCGSPPVEVNQFGITEPESVIITSKELIDGDNITKQWYNHYVEENKGSILTIKDAWDHFEKYYDLTNTTKQWYNHYVEKNEGSILTLKDAWEHFSKYYDQTNTDGKNPMKKKFKKNMEDCIGLKVMKSSSIKDPMTHKVKTYMNFWRNYSLKALENLPKTHQQTTINQIR